MWGSGVAGHSGPAPAQLSRIGSWAACRPATAWEAGDRNPAPARQPAPTRSAPGTATRASGRIVGQELDIPEEFDPTAIRQIFRTNSILVCESFCSRWAVNLSRACGVLIHVWPIA